MKKFLKRIEKGKTRRNSSVTPLIENNNNVKDGYDFEDLREKTLAVLNVFSGERCEQRPQNEPRFTLHYLAQILNVPDVSNATADGCWCEVRPEPKSGPDNPELSLVERSVSEHFPKPPTPPYQNLQQHLLDLQQFVVRELLRLGPILEVTGLMGRLVDCYYRHTFDHLHILLQNVTTTQDLFILMNWVLHVLQSEEMFGHPDLKERVNIVPIIDWTIKAMDIVLENVQTEVGETLERILENEKTNERCNCDEDFDRLYIDTIQCIDGMQKETGQISSALSDKVQEVCFKELLTFVKSYKVQQIESLGKKVKTDKPETVHFLKTLKTCKELKLYAEKSQDIKISQEIVEILESLEASTLKLLMGIVTDLTKNHLKKYFRSDNQRLVLFAPVEEHFPKLQYGVDEQKRVMDDAYKLIVSIYVKRLIRRSQKDLQKSWSSDIGQRVTEDAETLHRMISDLAPGVQQWNLRLLKIPEILDCKDIDPLKLVVAGMQEDRLSKSEEVEFLPNLLRWKGLSKREVAEVMDALPPDLRPKPDPENMGTCFSFWSWFRRCLYPGED